jgi:hypothetical protein
VGKSRTKKKKGQGHFQENITNSIAIVQVEKELHFGIEFFV